MSRCGFLCWPVIAAIVGLAVLQNLQKISDRLFGGGQVRYPQPGFGTRGWFELPLNFGFRKRWVGMGGVGANDRTRRRFPLYPQRHTSRA